MARILQRSPTPSPPDRVPAAGQRPRGPTPSPTSSFAASRKRRCGTCVATPTGRRRGALLSPPFEHPIPYHRFWNRGTRSYGLLPAQHAEHLSARQGAGLARTVVLL